MTNVEWAKRQARKYEEECIRMGCRCDKADWQKATAEARRTYDPIQYRVWYLWRAYMKIVKEFEAEQEAKK